MNTLTQGSMNVLLISCVLSASIVVPSHAGDGVIVTGRDVQGHMYGRSSFGPDPYPQTANANPSREILGALSGELSDRDFGAVSSGLSGDAAADDSHDDGASPLPPLPPPPPPPLLDGTG